MRYRIRKLQSGVSLLELLVSIMLFCVVMMTFAMIFPGGYRLNLKTRMESRAAKVANGIAGKMLNLKFLEVNPDATFWSTTQITSLEQVEWLDAYHNQELRNILKDEVPYPFYLPNPDVDGVSGCSVYVLDRPMDRGTIAKIRIIIAWDEWSKFQKLTKYCVVVTYRSRNHL